MTSRVPALFAAATACCLTIVSLRAQEPAPLMSDTVFKNVQILKGIPVDEFMDTMGMFAASLGYDCVSCHSPNIYEQRATAYAEATPLVQRARQMIVMMNTINKNYFGGQPRVSCFTCHHAKNRPEFIPSLALQYGELLDDPNSMVIFPRAHELRRARHLRGIQHRRQPVPDRDRGAGAEPARPGRPHAGGRRREDLRRQERVGR
ncbi:MAG: photosynthetic reaction center cytochrome c subunit [Acidobacteria bacterium]|nr:photosynthetic reaction center cytochrome c subunit [Acidobacteriota bacterium]